MTDKIIFEDSYGDIPLSETHFVKKEMIYITDNNTSGTYNTNQIVYDNLGLSTNGRWLNFSEGFLVIPLVVTMTGRNAGDTASLDLTTVHGRSSDMSVILKNHFGTLISSIQVDYGNTSLIQTQQNLSSYMIFKQHMDVDDSYVARNINGYRPDSHTSWSYNAGGGSGSNATIQGEGMMNNNIGYQSSASMGCKIGGDVFNEGATIRSRDIMSIAVPSATTGYGSRGRELVFAGSNNDYIKSKTSYIEDSASAKTWFYNCTLQLKCIHDFFDKIPLVKGAQLKITLNINQCSFKFKKTADSILTLESGSNFPNGVNPLMVTSCGVIQGDIPLAVVNATSTLEAQKTALQYSARTGGSAPLVAGTYFVTASVCKNMWPEQTTLIAGGVNQTSKLTQTRLYVPAYSLKAEYEDMYMKKMKKSVVYCDTFMKEFQELSPGMDLQLQVTSSVTNPLRMIIIPMLARSAMGPDAYGPRVREQCSPFSSSPATTCPCTLSNFQVLVSGIQIYNQPAMYSYEQFMNEINPSGMSYGLDMFAGSGQMSLDKWINNYGYYVVNLERRLPELKTQACSLDVAFRIDSLLKLDFIVFVEVEKSMTIDLLTGGRDA